MKIPFQTSIITSRRSLVRRKQYKLLTPEEIMAITVGAQLEAVIPALGIGCTYLF